MERSWLETVQLLGLDTMVALILLALAVSALWKLLVALVHLGGRLFRRKVRVLPTSPRDVYPAQEWGPSP